MHKDLKPENVMMSSAKKAPIQDLHVVVVDFGLAQMLSPEGRGTEIAGTPPFMSPEAFVERDGAGAMIAVAIGEAFGMSGLDATRDMAELMEVLVLVRSRVRSSSSTDDVLGQQTAIQRCVGPLIVWLEKERDVGQLTVRQRVDLLWNIYSATVSRTVLAEKFPLVCSNEDLWNETMTPLFQSGGIAEPFRERRHWAIRFADVLLMLAGLGGFLLDQLITSGRWRFYIIIGSTMCFGLGALLWYYPMVERFPPMPPRIIEHSSPPMPRQRQPQISQPPAGGSDVPPAMAPPFPGNVPEQSSLGAATSSRVQDLAIGAEVICNGTGPTAPVQGQRGKVVSFRNYLYDVQLHSGLTLSQLPLAGLTAVPVVDYGQSGPDGGLQSSMGQGVYAPYVAGAEEPVKQQASRLRVALEKAYSLHSTQPAWAPLFWQAVKNEVDLFGLETMLSGVLRGHGYVGDQTVGPPRYEELKKQLTELESFAGPPHDVWPLLPLPMPELVTWKPKRSCRLRDRQKKRLQVRRAATGLIKVINSLHTGHVSTVLTSSDAEVRSRMKVTSARLLAVNHIISRVALEVRARRGFHLTGVQSLASLLKAPLDESGYVRPTGVRRIPMIADRMVEPKDERFIDMLEALPAEDAAYYAVEEHVVETGGKCGTMFKEVEQLDEFLAYLKRSDVQHLWQWDLMDNIKAIAGVSTVVKKNGYDQRKLIMQCASNYMFGDPTERAHLGMGGGARRDGDVQQFFEEKMNAEGPHLLMISVDLAEDPEWDFANPNTFSKLMGLAEEGLIDIFFGGPPCSTVARSRFVKIPGGPRPLRFRWAIWGRPDLRMHERARVLEANTLWLNFLALAESVASRGGGYLWEHPADPGVDPYPSIWATEEMCNFEDRVGGRRVHLHQCPFGGLAPKLTTLSGNLDDMELVDGVRCPGVSEHHQHGVSIGRCAEGGFYTRRLQTYPPKLCEALACMLMATIRRMALSQSGPTGALTMPESQSCWAPSRVPSASEEDGVAALSIDVCGEPETGECGCAVVNWWPVARDEVKAMAHVVPLMVCHVGAPILGWLFSTDAMGENDYDHGGFGIAVTELSDPEVDSLQQQGETLGRSIARLDRLHGAKFPQKALKPTVPYTLLPNKLFEPSRWMAVDHGRWRFGDHITIGESRTVLKMLRRVGGWPALHDRVCGCVRRLHPDLKQRVKEDTLIKYQKSFEMFTEYLQKQYDLVLTCPEDLDLLLMEFRTEADLTKAQHMTLVAAAEFFLPHVKGKLSVYGAFDYGVRLSLQTFRVRYPFGSTRKEVQARGRWLSESSFNTYIDIAGASHIAAQVSGQKLEQTARWIQHRIWRYFDLPESVDVSSQPGRLSGASDGPSSKVGQEPDSRAPGPPVCSSEASLAPAKVERAVWQARESSGGSSSSGYNLTANGKGKGRGILRRRGGSAEFDLPSVVGFGSGFGDAAVVLWLLGIAADLGEATSVAAGQAVNVTGAIAHAATDVITSATSNGLNSAENIWRGIDISQLVAHRCAGIMTMDDEHVLANWLNSSASSVLVPCMNEELKSQMLAAAASVSLSLTSLQTSSEILELTTSFNLTKVWAQLLPSGRLQLHYDQVMLQYDVCWANPLWTHWEIELGSEQEQILRLLRRAILDLPASSTVAGSATLELEVKFAKPLLRSRCRVWLRRLCWQISQQFLSGMVATWTGMGAVNVASSWFRGWAAIFVVVLSFSIVCFCKKIWSGMIFVSGQCFEVRLAILDGPLVVMPTPPAPLDSAELSSPVISPTLRSPELSSQSSSGDGSFAKVSAVRVWAGNFSQSCDIWSCGVMLFFMLSGTYPFMAKRIEEFPAAVAKEPDWSRIGGASSEAQYICFDMLRKHEADRPAAHELLSHSWFQRFGLGSSTSDIQKLGRGLLQVKERSSFERFVARLVATQMDAGQLKRINEVRLKRVLVALGATCLCPTFQAFRTFDLDKDGSLSREELVRGLTTLGASPEEAQKVMEELDVSRTGRISYTEFLAGVTDLRQRSPQERDRLLKLAWQQFGPDQRGMAALAARGLTVAELPKEFLKELRRGSAGEISFEAFRGLFAGDESCCVMNSFVGSLPRS
eukprot:symbB.v1.2.023253.t2/scaffold2112.1/size106475/3